MKNQLKTVVLLGVLRGLFSWFSTHPPMTERIARLRAMNRPHRSTPGSPSGAGRLRFSQ